MSDDRKRSAREAVEARAQETRQTILDAAETLFAERGFGAASMRAIARTAKTSQALLHHHFGTKQQLYEAVKHRFTERFVAAQKAPAPVELSPSFIITFVRDYFRYLTAHPHLTRFFSWARLEGDDTPWGTSDEVWSLARNFVVAAKGAGWIRRDVDERLLLAIGGALVQYWIDNRRFLCRALELDPDDPDLDERYIREALSILMRGIATADTPGLDAFERNDSADT